MNIALASMALDLPPVLRHPNRVPFRGVLTLVDALSDRPPAGARGHRVLLTRAAAEAALGSLLGMGLDYAPSLDAHDARRKIGIITSAEILPLSEIAALGKPRAERGPPISPTVGAQGFVSGHGFSLAEGVAQSSAALAAAAAANRQPPTENCISVTGHLFARDFPDVLRELRAAGPTLGMSYELVDVVIADPAAPVWVLTAATFTGAAVLRRDKAAYSRTTFEI